VLSVGTVLNAMLNTLLLGFYQNEFHDAKAATAPSHIAKDIVEKVKQAGHKVILATNPIFPREAVLSRLSWIDLTQDDFDYITTYEISHYCKPNPDYYKEILENCNLQPAECVMIGNDVKEDIVPASSLQIPTYLVKDYQIGDESGLDTDAGSLAQVIAYLNI
jgi:HAD superfamily hydrolase (TIGR01549 family)